MRNALVISAVYLLALTMVPCSDIMGKTNNEGFKDIAATLAETDGCEHGHEHPCADDCTALCACDCCHVHVLLIELASISLPDISHTGFSSHYQDPFSSSHFRNQFRPPRG